MKGSSTSGHSYVFWIIVILFALIVYVATWPIVEMKCSTVTSSFSTTSPDGFTFTAEEVRMSPRWTGILYLPLHTLSKHDGGDNLLMRYYGWCLETF